MRIANRTGHRGRARSDRDRGLQGGDTGGPADTQVGQTKTVAELAELDKVGLIGVPRLLAGGRIAPEVEAVSRARRRRGKKRHQEGGFGSLLC
jgi:hypothetical protein